jgi:hypothetical protein
VQWQRRDSADVAAHHDMYSGRCGLKHRLE